MPNWSVVLDRQGFEVADPQGAIIKLAATDLRGVTIETSDSAPLGLDLWWLLVGPDDRVACAFPQGADGDGAAIGRLMELPGFDHGAMLGAMLSTEKAIFPVWRAV